MLTLCEGSLICSTGATDIVAWVEGLTPFQASHFLPSVVFNCRPLWPVATKPKGLLLARAIMWLSLPKSSCMVDGGGRVQGAEGGSDMTSRGTCLRAVSVERQVPTLKWAKGQGALCVVRRVCKIPKSDCWLHHVCLSARNKTAPTGRIFMKFYI
jgi:hypothetical protein